MIKNLIPKQKDSFWSNQGKTIHPSWGSSSLTDHQPSRGTAGSSVIVSNKKSQDNHGFYIGQNVFHSKFGEGRILNFEGQADQAKAQVNFARHGVKLLQLSIAKLTPI